VRFLRRDGLSRRLRARLDEHERQAERLLAHLRHDAGDGRANVSLMMGAERVPYLEQSDVEALPSMTLLDEEDDERKVSVAVACAVAVVSPYTLESGVVRRLLRRPLPWTSEDAELLLRHGVSAPDRLVIDRLGWATKAAEDFVGSGGDPDVLRPHLEQAATQIESSDAGFASERKALRKRIRTLLSISARAPAALDLKLVGDDAWGKRVRALVAEHWPDDREVGALLLHLGEATKGPRPTQAWERRRDELLSATAAGERVVQMLLESALTTEDTTSDIRYGNERYVVATWVSDPSEVLLRGAVWAAAPYVWAPQLLGQLAEHAARPAIRGGDPRSLVVANAAARTLAALDPPGVEPLARLVHLVKHRGVRKQIERALDEAAQRAGVSRWRLLETAVERHGLDENGRRELALGDDTAVLAALPPGRPQLTFLNPDGKELRSTPAAARENHPEDLRQLRGERGSLDKTLKAERRRLESMLAAEMAWGYADWQPLYLGHGVTRAIAGALLWSIDGQALLPRGDALVDAAGRQHEPSSNAEVRLWHPLDAERTEALTWRRFLIDEQIVQPYKQAHRETYVLVPAEEETRTYSNRFAGHVLRYPQVYALQKERGWSGNALGPWDGGFDAGLRLELADTGLIAEFWIESVDQDFEGPLAELCTTDQVRFYRADAEAEGAMPLADVPPRAFSEAMRDVDLFVSVASIGADPTWQDRGERHYDDYWERTVFPEALTESARVRRELLIDLLPRLAIADRCELEATCLRVRGNRGSYRIHLASAAVTMEPDGRFLCIVPSRGKKHDLFLPFEGDIRLSEILSKAFLLSADTKIRDPTIVRQMNAR
jgi:hypothetical protein